MFEDEELVEDEALPQMPGLPSQDALKKQLYANLMSRMNGVDPMAADRKAAGDEMRQNAFAASLAKSMDKMGTVGGQSVRNNAVGEMAENLGQATGQELEAKSQGIGQQDKIRNYLYEQIQKNEQVNAQIKARALAQKKAMEQRIALQKQNQDFTAGESAKNRDHEARLRYAAMNQADYGLDFVGDNGNKWVVDRKTGKATDTGVQASMKDRLGASGAEGMQPIYGAKPMPGMVPNAKDAETVKVARQNRDAIIQDIAKIDALYKQHGNQLVGDAAKTYRGLMTDIQIKLKEINKLGVLNGPDLGLVAAQFVDPSSVEDNAKAFFGESRYIPVRDMFVKTLEDNFDSDLRARGYQRTDQRAGTMQKGASSDWNKQTGASGNWDNSLSLPPPPEGKVRVRSANGDIGLVDAAELQEALSEGYTEVK